MNRTGPGGTYAAPALEKAFEIVELLADHPEGALISEMATMLGRSIGELFRIVIVMEKHGYLQKSALTDRYTVAYKILDLAYRATPAQNLVRAAGQEMQRLALDVGQSCHLVVPNGGQGLVIAREENPGTRGFALKLGASVDMIRSCSGQVILAFAAPHRRERIVELAEALRDTPIDREELFARIETVCAQGFDMRQSPITFGVTDISFPLFGFDGELMGALTVPFLEHIDGSQKLDLAATRDRLRQAAAIISATLGAHST